MWLASSQLGLIEMALHVTKNYGAISAKEITKRTHRIIAASHRSQRYLIITRETLVFYFWCSPASWVWIRLAGLLNKISRDRSKSVHPASSAKPR